MAIPKVLLEQPRKKQKKQKTVSRAERSLKEVYFYLYMLITKRSVTTELLRLSHF